MRIGLVLFRLLQRIQLKSGRSWLEIIRLLKRFVRRLLSNPPVAELLRFIFLGTVVETGRIVGQKVVDVVSSCRLVSLPFTSPQIIYIASTVFVVGRVITPSFSALTAFE